MKTKLSRFFTYVISAGLVSMLFAGAAVGATTPGICATSRQCECPIAVYRSTGLRQVTECHCLSNTVGQSPSGKLHRSREGLTIDNRVHATGE